MAATGNDITRVLEAVERGESASERLLPIVYEELRKLAASRMAREQPGQTAAGDCPGPRGLAQSGAGGYTNRD